MKDNRLLLLEYNGLSSKAAISVEDGFLILKGVVQRPDVKNGNGRIYPKSILEREDRKYQQLIAENRAAGEANHPQCFREGAKILTLDGWKDFKNIIDNEQVFTLNTKTHLIELQIITNKINKPYIGNLLAFKGLNLDTAVTPNHKFYLIDRYGNDLVVTAEEIYNNRTKYDKCYIPKLGIYYPENQQDIFILPELKYISPKCSFMLKEKYTKPVEISMDIWSSFLGLFLAEGWTTKVAKNSYYIGIAQNIGDKCDKIEELLNKMPFKWVKRIKKNGKSVVFSTSDMRLGQYLTPLGKAWEKYIPTEMKNIAPQYCENIINWYLLGDGRKVWHKSCNRYSIQLFSTSRRLIEDLSEILIKSGGSGNIWTEKRNHIDGKIEGRLIKKENRRDMHFITLSTTKGIYLDQRFLEIKKVPYNGNVYCVEVPNHTFFCMDSNKIFISGNSSEIDIKNISHLIKETWWKNNELYAKLQLTSNSVGRDLKELVERDGLTLGISTRGLGSITVKEGISYVNEDYSLICYDLVFDPSVAGAYMLKEGKYVKIDDNALTEGRIIESKEYKNTTAVSNKLDNIIDEILSLGKVK